MDPSVFIPALFVVPALGAGVAWWLAPKQRARRLIRRAKEKLLGAVAGGDHVRVLGLVRSARETLCAPYSGRRCVAFRAVVYTADHANDDKGSEISRVERSVPFFLVADGIEARVEGPFLLGLEIDDRGTEAELPRGAFKEARRFLVGLRWNEATLEEGDPVWVLGRARVAIDPQGQPEELRGQPVLRVFAGTKRTPVVVADEDSPGDLDWLSR
jgi:hypothetical protein